MQKIHFKYLKLKVTAKEDSYGSVLSVFFFFKLHLKINEPSFHPEQIDNQINKYKTNINHLNVCMVALL